MQATLSNPHPAEKGLKTTHLLLSVQSLLLLLVLINRLSNLTVGYVSPNQFLRWVDLHNMLTLPLISLVAFAVLMRYLEYDSPARSSLAHHALWITFAVGIYLLGAGYGDHEVTNYLHARFCTPNDT